MIIYCLTNYSIKLKEARIWAWILRLFRTVHKWEGRIEISVPRIAVWHHEACRVTTSGDPEGRIFLSYPHTNNGFLFRVFCPVMTSGDPEGRIFLSYSHTNNGFFFLADYCCFCFFVVFFKKIRFQRSLITRRCNLTWWRHFNITMNNDVTWRPCAWVPIQPIHVALTWQPE